jgi:hypothetical protein
VSETQVHTMAQGGDRGIMVIVFVLPRSLANHRNAALEPIEAARFDFFLLCQVHFHTEQFLANTSMLDGSAKF